MCNGIARTSFGNYTNYGTAKRFLSLVGEDYHYCEDTGKWMQFDEKTNLWKEKSEEQMIHIIKDIGEAVRQDSMDMITFEGEPKDDADKRVLAAQMKAQADALGYAAKLEGKAYALNSLYFCKGISEDGITIPCNVDDFDADPQFICLSDGKVYDLINGKILPGDKKYMMTKALKGTVKEKVSEDFLSWVCKMFPDKEVLNYIQMYFGSALLGWKLRNSDDKNGLFIDSSMPDTGKSALLTLMENSLGDYFRMADYSLLIQKKKADSDKASPSIAALRGCRFLGISECPPGMILDDAFWKQITGNDTLTARDVFGKTFQFKPNFKLVLVSNHLPMPKNVDDQAWRKRFRRHTCETSLSFMDENLLKKFNTQEFHDDFITWLVEGCKKYQLAGRLDNYNGKNLKESNIPASMKKAMLEFFKENDDIGDFISTWFTITKDSKDFLPLSEMWEVWTKHNYDRSKKVREFNKEVKDFFSKRLKLEFVKRPFEKTDERTEEIIRSYGYGFTGIRYLSDADILDAKVKTGMIKSPKRKVNIKVVN